jgi:hypothetical protein
MTASADVAALQRCLAAEHAAVYGYGVVGGRLAGIADAADAIDLAERSYDQHRAARDRLTALAARLGARPVAAKPAYDTPFTPAALVGCRRLARLMERRCCEEYAYAVAQPTTREVRRVLARGLTDSAVRGVWWGAAPQPFPGRPDL